MVKVNQHPFWMFEKKSEYKMTEFIKIKNKPQRRQDLPDLYYVNDALYITKTKYFDTDSMTNPIFDMSDMSYLVMKDLNSFDINSELDFKILKACTKCLKTIPEKLFNFGENSYTFLVATLHKYYSIFLTFFP